MALALSVFMVTNVVCWLYTLVISATTAINNPRYWRQLWYLTVVALLMFGGAIAALVIYSALAEDLFLLWR